MRRGRLVGRKDMARIGDQDEFRASDALSDQVAVCRGDKPIGIAMYQQGARSNLRQATIGLPTHDSLELGREAGVARIPLSANSHVLFDSFARSGRMIDERIHGFCEFVGTQAPAKQHLEYLGIGLNGVRSACRRATQKERVDALRVLQSKFLRDHATHGNAEDARALDAGSIEHGGRIRGHQRDGIRSGRHIAPAHAPIVERYRPLALRENWPCTVPHRGCPTKAHNQQNRRSPTLFVPVDPGALIIGKRHWHSSSRREDDLSAARSIDPTTLMIAAYI